MSESILGRSWRTVKVDYQYKDEPWGYLSWSGNLTSKNNDTAMGKTCVCRGCDLSKWRSKITTPNSLCSQSILERMNRIYFESITLFFLIWPNFNSFSIGMNDLKVVISCQLLFKDMFLLMYISGFKSEYFYKLKHHQLLQIHWFQSSPN